MRASWVLAGVLIAAAAVSTAWADEAPRRRLTNEQLDAFLHQARAKPEKPGGASRAPIRGSDTCQWAHDLECDEPDIGTGACSTGTDYSDCRFLRSGETDDCEWARDGECDEPGLGTGVCTQGTDRTDCADIAELRFQTDTCETAFNGVCEEEGTRRRNGPAQCEARTDRADCVGRERPMTINDHFQGYDDRVLVDTSVFPWSAIGELDFDDESICTGTLVAADVVLTAAHCVHNEDGQISAGGVFRSGAGRPGGAQQARIIGYFISPRFSHDLFFNSNKLDGTDWAYLRIDRPLGETLGMLPIDPILTLDDVELDQAGYSWDTGDHLSGHLGCQGISLNSDGTLEHACDTTRGDSGSPLMIAGDHHTVVAVDSNYREKEDGPVVNIAAGAIGFARYLDQFVAHEIGTTIEVPVKVKGGRP